MSKEISKDLMDPNAYPEPTKKVDLIQTHISFIFITDDLVYKVKKPVDFGFLDFTTLDKRLFYCQAEVELNKRLSPDVYLGVLPITDESDRLVVNGKGEVVEYTVKMKKIPMDRLMKKLLKEGRVIPEMVDKVAEKIASFHEEAQSSDEIAKFGSLETIKFNTDENFQQTESFIGKTISKAQFDLLKDYTNNFYKNNDHVIEKRIEEDKIKDCHGDLHLEHICIADPIIIFDCIEFNERFRYSDTAADIAFLAMDLDFQGRKDLSKVLMDSYVKHSDDEGVLDMLNFYKIYRAYVRGKVIGFQLGDPHISQEDKEKARKLAQSYFELAASYTKGEKEA
jgi:aminoglycoside phosphotransferase family enzyme